MNCKTGRAERAVTTPCFTVSAGWRQNSGIIARHADLVTGRTEEWKTMKLIFLFIPVPESFVKWTGGLREGPIFLLYAIKTIRPLMD